MSSKKMPHRSVLMARTPALSSVAVSLSVMVWPSAGYSSAGATETVVGIVIEPLFSFGIAMGGCVAESRTPSCEPYMYRYIY